MNRVIDILKMMLHYFSVITVAVTVVAAGYITVFYGGDAVIEAGILWQILLVSFLCSICNLFFYKEGGKELERKQLMLRWILCYVYVNIVVLGAGFLFGWFDIASLPMVIGMLVAVVVAFGFIRVCIFLFDMKTTDEINQKLRERNGEESF